MTHLLLYISDQNALNNGLSVAKNECEVIFDLNEVKSYLPSEVMLMIELFSEPEEQEQIKELIVLGYPVVLLSKLPSPEEAISWFTLGIKGYLNIHASSERIQQAVDVVRMGNIWLGQNIMQALILQATNQPNPNATLGWQEIVTEREQETLHWVMQGKSNLEIAEEMHISERTVKAHISHLLEKFSVKDRLALVLHIQNWQN